MTENTFHSTYRGVDIYKAFPSGMYIAMVEDGYFTYSYLNYKADTLKGIKSLIKGYFDQIKASRGNR